MFKKMFRKEKPLSEHDKLVREWREFNAEVDRDRKKREEEYKKAHRNDRQNYVVKGVFAWQKPNSFQEFAARRVFCENHNLSR